MIAIGGRSSAGGTETKDPNVFSHAVRDVNKYKRVYDIVGVCVWGVWVDFGL